MSFYNPSSTGLIRVISVFLALLNLLPNSTAPKCGHIDSCDRLISYSVFQRGACGRAARCYWEISHLENGLEGISTNTATYEETIKEMLCLIPTLKAYNNIRAIHEDKTLEEYLPCGTFSMEDGDKMANKSFDFYPMSTFYTFESSLAAAKGDEKPLHYLNRMGNCTKMEEDCNKKLQLKVDTLCDLLDKNALRKLESKFQMKLRHHKFYQLAVLHPDLVTKDGITFSAGFSSRTTRLFNNCSLLQFRRIRHNDGDNGDSTDGQPTFEDGYGFNTLDRRLRGPYFDLYLLYEADPLGKFENVQKEDRWWNETKAYQELAHRLPTDMLQDIHDAIECIYYKVGTPELVWNPKKFCWGYSTFICVDNSVIKGNDCKGTVNTDARHFVDSTVVPPTGLPRNRGTN